MAIGEYIPIDSVPPPEIVPLRGIPRKVSAHPNRFPAGQPKVIPLPDKLTVITPGENGVPMPKVVPATGKVIPAGQPKWFPALPPKYKEGAIIDIQNLEIDVGQKSNEINTVFEDSRGYMWFGTGAGAIRYDGKNMQLFTGKEGFGLRGVTNITEDQHGRMWFGNFRDGVVCYDGANFIQYTEKEGLSKNFIRGIQEDDSGKIWIATQGGGLLCFDGSNFTIYTEKEGLISDDAVSMKKDRHGNIWIGTFNSGACKFDGKSFTHYTKQEGLSGNLIFTITEDDQGNIWFGTGNGASRFDGISFSNFAETEGLMGSLVHGIVQTEDGKIWIAASDPGIMSKSALHCYDGKTFTRFTENEGLTHNRLMWLYLGSKGRIWAGAQYGTNRININGFTSFDKKNGLEYELMVSDILPITHNDLWLGTHAGGLIHYDGDSYSYINIKEGLKGYTINNLIKDNSGNLWFDYGGRGVTRFNGKTFAHYSIDSLPKLFKPLIKDSKGNPWFRTNYCAASFDGKGFSTFTINDSTSRFPIYSLVEDKQGAIWFCTSIEGIIRFKDGNFTQYSIQDIFGEPITAAADGSMLRKIFEDSRGNIWILTVEDGIVCFDGNDFVRYTESDGLGSNIVYSITEDRQGVIWVTRNKGLSLLVKKPDALQEGDNPLGAKKQFKIFNFDERDGLKGKRLIAICPDPKNNMWIGSEKGLMKLDLNRFALPSDIPNVRLVNIELMQQFVDFTKLGDSAYQRELPIAKKIKRGVQAVSPFFNLPKTLALPHDLNHLTFHFSATDWSAPHKIVYSFYMDGLEKTWSIPQSESYVDYRNLTPGSYTFRVRAMGASQIWSEPFEYKFRIRPPWYRSWVAYVLYLVAAGIILVLLRNYELNRQLAKSEASRLQELDNFKSRFYTNITHEFRTPLTVIVGLAEQLVSNAKGDLKANLEMIHRNGRQVLLLVNQMLDLSKLESGSIPLNMVQGDAILFLQYLLESFHSLADQKQIALNFISDQKACWMDFDPDKLQKITANLLSNAIKFSPQNGTVSLSATTTAESSAQFVFSVSDTGPGISKKDLPYIFDRFYQADDSATRMAEGTGIGLALTKELVKLLGGSIQVENQPHSGAKFTVMLPLRQNAPRIEALPDMQTQQVAVSPALPNRKETLLPDAAKPTLLIIEDNQDVVSYLSMLLAKDYNLKLAPNGRKGLDEAFRLIPDLIISDVMMPEVDGFEVCRTLKTDKRSSHIPIVMLTAKADIGSRIEGLELGADAYLAKPFEERELRVVLRKLHELRQALRERYATPGWASAIDSPVFSREDAFFREVYAVLENNFSEPEFGVPEFSKAMNMTRITLYRKLVALTGKNVEDFLRSFRLQKGYSMLQKTDEPIKTIAWDCGFKDHAYFTRCFQEEFGILPSDLRS